MNSCWQYYKVVSNLEDKKILSRWVVTMSQIKFLFTRSKLLAPITRQLLRIVNIVARLNPLQKYSVRVTTLRYLNVGCGKKPHVHTINLNYEWYPFVDLTWDITKKLPLKANSLKGIYTEHVLEHLPFACIPKILEELRRVLEPNGLLRILVPDAELYLSTYAKIKNGAAIKFPFHDNGKTPIMIVNQVFRDHGHLFAYDFETFERLLNEAGFRQVKKCNHKESGDPNLMLDSDERAPESLRIECIK